MISYIKGNLIEKQEGYLVIDNQGIGYQVFVSNNTLEALPANHEEVQILTYMHVREDDMVLFGFLSAEEKDLFLKMITVSGIGPKGAMGILSGMNLSDLMVAIKNEDIKFLTRIKGLGKKTAERLCLELKDKINVLGTVEYKQDLPTGILNEAIEALVTLGVNKSNATEMVRAVAKENSTVEEIITLALQNMGR